MNHPLTSETEYDVRDIVGLMWDSEHELMPERHCLMRALTITAVHDAYEFAHHVIIALSGTPPRGLIIVNVADEYPSGYDMIGQCQISWKDAQLLREFVTEVSGMASNQLRTNFSWSSPIR